MSPACSERVLRSKSVSHVDQLEGKFHVCFPKEYAPDKSELVRGVIDVHALAMNVVECHKMRDNADALMKKPALVEKLMVTRAACAAAWQSNGWLQTLPASVASKLHQELLKEVDEFSNTIKEKVILDLEHARHAVADLTGGLRQGRSWKEGLASNAEWDVVFEKVTVLMHGEASRAVYAGYQTLKEDLALRVLLFLRICAEKKVVDRRPLFHHHPLACFPHHACAKAFRAVQPTTSVVNQCTRHPCLW